MEDKPPSPVSTARFIGGLPLVVWPFVAVASVMSVAGERTGHESPWVLFIVQAFCWISIAYPVVYISCTLIARRKLRSGALRGAMITALIPLVCLLVAVALFFTWMQLDNRA
jgi:hypothetical protein